VIARQGILQDIAQSSVRHFIHVQPAFLTKQQTSMYRLGQCDALPVHQKSDRAMHNKQKLVQMTEGYDEKICLINSLSKGLNWQLDLPKNLMILE